MKAKEDKIREAYGEYWQEVKDFVDENGWIINAISITRNVNLEMQRFYDNTRFLCRPKSLQGIENNNGWIKIESEDNLPKDGNYWVFTKSGEIIDSPKYADGECLFNDNKYWIENFTHYQSIQKPLLPIY